MTITLYAQTSRNNYNINKYTLFLSAVRVIKRVWQREKTYNMLSFGLNGRNILDIRAYDNDTVMEL